LCWLVLETCLAKKSYALETEPGLDLCFSECCIAICTRLETVVFVCWAYYATRYLSLYMKVYNMLSSVIQDICQVLGFSV